MADGLAVWDFCYTFSAVLRLSRFSFDSFCDALIDRDPVMSPLMKEGKYGEVARMVKLLLYSSPFITIMAI